VTRLGFVGTGAITEAMVVGLLVAPPAASEILVSPRNGEIARRLADRFSAVRIAFDNQEVIDGSDLVVLAVRPQIAEDVIRALRFRDGLSVISVIAATGRDALLSWIAAKVRLTQAIPLPFVARREGVTAIYPPEPEVVALFALLGAAVECQNREEYDLLGAASALMTTYFGLMDRTVAWLRDHGLPEDKGLAYLAPLFAQLSQTALRADTQSLPDFSREFATKGGLNEQVFADFEKNGGSDALRQALDRVLARIRGVAPE
jgi:pyrroline-5-carboxylate reductase